MPDPCFSWMHTGKDTQPVVYSKAEGQGVVTFPELRYISVDEVIDARISILNQKHKSGTQINQPCY